MAEKYNGSRDDVDSESGSSSYHEAQGLLGTSAKTPPRPQHSQCHRYVRLTLHAFILVLTSLIFYFLGATTWNPRSHPDSNTSVTGFLPAATLPNAISSATMASAATETFKPHAVGDVLYTDPTHNYLMKSPCGRTAEEARSRKCHFEILSFSWVPDECHDHERVEEFRNSDDWNFWLHKNKTGRVSVQEAKTGEYDLLHTDWNYHMHHCVASFNRFHHTLLVKGVEGIDSNIGRLSHSEHCGRNLIRGVTQDIGIDDANTYVQRKFPDCGLIL